MNDSVDPVDPADPVAGLDGRALLDALHEGFAACELARGREDEPVGCRVTYLNEAFRAHAGTEPAAVLGRDVADALPGAVPHQVAELVAVGATGRTASFTCPAATPGRWCDVRAYAMGGDRVGVLVLDVTERERARARRREGGADASTGAPVTVPTDAPHRDELDAIARLGGGVAHDFNNLLMGMRSSLELLGDRLPAGDRAGRALLFDALAGAARGAVLTRRMLAFARRQELAPTAIDVGAHVVGAADLLSRALGPGVRLRTDLDADAPPAFVDPQQLELVLLSLIGNAGEAMAGAGELRVRVRGADVGAHGPLAPGAYVRLDVADTGRGMTPAALARATEPLFTTKSVGIGAGLGLSMVRDFAHRSGGSFELASEPGRGTVATLLLPAAAGVGARPDAPAAAPGARRRVLVVDDDALVLRGLVGILARLGHDVVQAPSGERAFALFARDGGFDVVLTDQIMPGMTGLELAARVKRHRPATPVILATGYSDLPVTDSTLIDVRLDKPFDRRRLEAALRDVSPG